MKTIKSPLSIRIIYWLTNFSFGILSIVFLAVIVFNVLLYTNFFGNDLQLHTQLPVKVDFLEVGNLQLNDENVKVELVEATSKIHFFNTPSIISTKVGFALIMVVTIAIYLTWVFRKFIKNVKNGLTFTNENIGLLKKLAYGIATLWLFTIIYNRVFYYSIVNRLEFEYVSISNDLPNYSGILLLALFIWVLAHIFMSGIKLQEEQDLTI